MSISAPTDLANCKLWLDGSDATQMDSGGGLTYNWNDKSGQGNHAVCQSHKPFTIHKSPLASRRVLRIGGNDGGTGGGYVSINGVATHLMGNFTITVVGGSQFETTAGGKWFIGAGRSTTATPLVGLNIANSKYQGFRRNDANTLRQLTSSANANNTLALHVLIYDGTNLTYRLNGAQIGQGTASGAITLDQFALGVSPRDTLINPGYAIYDTVVVYSDAKSGTDLTDLETLLLAYCPSLTGQIANTLPESFRPILCRVADNAGVITHTYSDAYADFDDNAGTGLYYFDYYSGNDANAGTIASPLQTPDAAFAKTDVKWIKNKRLMCPGGWGSSYTRPDRGCGISPYLLSKTWFYNGETGTWSKTAGQTFVYEITRTTATTRVFDVTSRNAITGEPLVYTSVGSIALCDSTQGSYFSDSGTGKVYAHAFDNRAIDVDAGIGVQIGVMNPRIPFTSANRPWMMQNVGFVGLGHATQTWDIALSRQFFHNVESHFGTEWSLTNPENVDYYRCKMTNSDADFFDYRGDTIGLEVECVADLTAAADANNGTTGHDTATIMSVKGLYKRASRNVHDIDTVNRQMIDCDSNSAHNGAGGTDTDVGYFCGANDGGTDACVMNLYKCRTDGGNITDLIAEKGCQILCRFMSPLRFTQIVRSPGTITFSNVPSISQFVSVSPVVQSSYNF